MSFASRLPLGFEPVHSMNHHLSWRAPGLLATLALWLCAPVEAADTAQTFSAAELRADLAQLRTALHDMPADLAHSVDERQLEAALLTLDGQLATSPPLTRDGAWRVFATLNPLLADAHLLVGFSDWRGDTRAHLARGDVFFPFEVRMSSDCTLRVRALLGGGDTPLAGAGLATIDGVPARQVCEQVLARMQGDTVKFRADLASRRFWLLYWKVFGAPRTFDLGFDDGTTVSMPGGATLPQLLAIEDSFERQFRLELLPGDVAVLTLGTFALPDKQPLLDFTRASFEKLRAARTKTLLIDVRDNGGGDDVNWIEGVMPYVATGRYRTGSTFRKRVVNPDVAKGEVAGNIVDGEIETWYRPQLRNALRFKGTIYVLVGRGTYSSAVLFANVMNEFGFARLVGTGGSVRADQSGGTRRTTLSHTGLAVISPRFVLHRPSGKTLPMYLTPAIEMDDSLAAPEIAGRLE
jgi:hypothetical protein